MLIPRPVQEQAGRVGARQAGKEAGGVSVSCSSFQVPGHRLLKAGEGGMPCTSPPLFYSALLGVSKHNRHSCPAALPTEALPFFPAPREAGGRFLVPSHRTAFCSAWQVPPVLMSLSSVTAGR